MSHKTPSPNAVVEGKTPSPNVITGGEKEREEMKEGRRRRGLLKF